MTRRGLFGLLVCAAAWRPRPVPVIRPRKLLARIRLTREALAASIAAPGAWMTAVHADLARERDAWRAGR